MRYSIFNLCFAFLVLPSCWLLTQWGDRRRQLLFAARIALLVTLLAYPWDYFAIHLGAWSYPVDPGSVVNRVPINDLIFMILCTLLTSCALLAARRWEDHGDRHSERKDTRKEDTRNEGE